MKQQLILIIAILILPTALAITPQDNYNLRNYYNMTGLNVIQALDWTNITITESQISDLTHTTNTYNTTAEIQAAQTTYNNGSGINQTGTTFRILACDNGEILEYNTANDQWECGTDDSGVGESYDQYLNTTNEVIFANISSGKLNITNPTDTNAIKIDQNGNAGESTSTGGAILLDNTDNVGAGQVIYSNIGSTANGHLLSIRADHVDFDQSALYISYDGTANALNIANSGIGSDNGALNVGSTNPAESAIKVTSNTSGRGAIKVSHFGNTSTTAASALSIDLRGTNTAAQGIFIDSTDGRTSGDLVNIRQNGDEMFVLNSIGTIQLNGNITFDGDPLSFIHDAREINTLSSSSLFFDIDGNGAMYFRDSANAQLLEINNDNISVKKTLCMGDDADCITAWSEVNGSAVDTYNTTAEIQAAQITYDNGTGINMTGTTFSVIACDNGEILEYNTGNDQWECGVDTTGSGGKSGASPYLYNDTDSIILNDTFLNITIDDRDSDTWNTTAEIQAAQLWNTTSEIRAAQLTNTSAEIAVVKVNNASFADDSDLLDGQEGSYYLDNVDTWNTTDEIRAAQLWNTTEEIQAAQLWNTTSEIQAAQTINTSAEIAVVKVNNATNADLLEGQPGSYYLNADSDWTLYGTDNINHSSGYVNVSNLVVDQFYTPNLMGFNFYDDGAEIYLNLTSGDALNIETDNSQIILYNAPAAGNDYKVFQVYSKEGGDETEFAVTKAGFGHAAYFVRSLSVGGGDLADPWNCTTYADHINCDTGGDSGGDLYVRDDAEINGTIFSEVAVSHDWTNVSILESQIGDLTHTADTWNTTAEIQAAQLWNTTSEIQAAQTVNTSAEITVVKVDNSTNADLLEGQDGSYYLDDTNLSAGNGISESGGTLSVAGNTALTQDSDGLSLTVTQITGCTDLTTDKLIWNSTSSILTCASDFGQDTQKTTSGPYLYNDTDTIYFNDTFLNITIDDRDTDTWNTTAEIQAAQTVNTTAEIRAAQLWNTTSEIQAAQTVNTSSEIQVVKVNNASWADEAFLLDGQEGSYYLDDTDTQKNTNPPYLFNDSDTIYFNDTFLNITIDDRTVDTYNTTAEIRSAQLWNTTSEIQAAQTVNTTAEIRAAQTVNTSSEIQVVKVDNATFADDSDLLDGQEGAYYLDDTWNTTSEIQAAQTINTSAEIRAAQLWNTTSEIQAAQTVNTSAEIQVVKVDNATWSDDSALLEGQDGSYYLDDTWNTTAEIQAAQLWNTTSEIQAAQLVNTSSEMTAATTGVINSSAWNTTTGGITTLSNLTGYVGIGTVSPSTFMELNIGTNAAEGFLFQDTSDSDRSARIFFEGDSNDGNAIYHSFTGLHITTGATAGTTSGSSTVIIDPDGLNVSAGADICITGSNCLSSSATDTNLSAGDGLNESGGVISINSSDIVGCTDLSTEKLIWNATTSIISCAADQTTAGGTNSSDEMRAAVTGWVNSTAFNYTNKSAILADNDALLGLGHTDPASLLDVRKSNSVVGYSTSGSGTVFGELYVSSGVSYNVGFTSDWDGMPFWMNYVGYQKGTTRFRDFIVGDGKTNQVMRINGSTANMMLGAGPEAPSHKLVVDGYINTTGGAIFDDTVNISGDVNVEDNDKICLGDSQDVCLIYNTSINALQIG